jgi:integrase
MGDIVRRGTKDKPRFYIRYKDANGRRTQRAVPGVTSAAEAKRLLAAAELRVSQGKVGIEEPTEEQQAQRSITLDALVERFNAEYRPPRLKNPEDYRKQTVTVYNCRIKPALGYRAAASITTLDVERLRDQLLAEVPGVRDGYAPKSVSWTMARLSKVYVWGRKVGAIDCPSPVAGVEHPRSEHTVDFLSKQEVANLLALLERDNAELYPMAATAIFAGLRKGELYGLRWIDVHLERAQLTVARSYTFAPKSGKPRHLPLHPELARILTEWKKRCPVTDEGLVFPVVDGTGVYRMGIKTDMRGLAVNLRRAECHVPPKPWHALRHTFASHFMMAGGNILTLQKLLGHADLTMTMIYAHLAPDFMANEIARMSFHVPTAGVSDLGEQRRRRQAEQSGEPVDTSCNGSEASDGDRAAKREPESTFRTWPASCAAPRG